MASSGTWIVSVKALLICTGVASIAMAMKSFVPLMFNFAVSEAPAIWSGVISWLKPPYLYFVVNGIIITIAASSRFYHNKLDDDDQSQSHSHPPPMIPASASLPHPPTPPSDLPPVSIERDFAVVELPVVYESEPRVLDVKPVMINGTEVVSDEEDEDEDEDEGEGEGEVEGEGEGEGESEGEGEGEDENESEFVISRSTWSPLERIDSLDNLPGYAFPVMEKPLVSSRFGHRKPAKINPEGGRALRVAKAKRRHETLENTWRTITDGRQMPLTRHLRKSDTWENHGRNIHVTGPLDSSFSPSPQLVNKSETFKDRTNYDNSAVNSPSPGKLKKESSPSQDELNRRVEAFIKKFNDEMRLQRQQSLQQYMEMINRGAH